MIEKVGLYISEEDMALIQSNRLIRTDGILRNAKDMTIYKHLEIITLSENSIKQEIVSQIRGYIKENKKEMIAIGIGIFAIIAGLIVLVIKKRNRSRIIEEKYNIWFSKALQDYFTAASENRLDLETIQECEDAIVSLPKITNRIVLSISGERLMEFSENLRNYTEQLA